MFDFVHVSVKIAWYCALRKEAVPGIWAHGFGSQEVSWHRLCDGTADAFSQGSMSFHIHCGAMMWLIQDNFVSAEKFTFT